MAACEAMRATDASWRSEKWVPRENVHITLKFIGNVAEDALGSLADAVEHVTMTHTVFELPCADVHVVPNSHRARMLWGTFADPEERCAALAADLDRACLEYGAQPEERTFKPHATLVRARVPRPLAESALEEARLALAPSPGTVSVASITLFSSRLTPRGPIYTELRECGLKSA